MIRYVCVSYPQTLVIAATDGLKDFCMAEGVAATLLYTVSDLTVVLLPHGLAAATVILPETNDDEKMTLTLVSP
jgi:hypothetical protein